MTLSSETILIVFVAFTGASVLLQACILFAILISLRKSTAAAMQVTDDLKATMVPMVHSTRELVERLSPQLLTVASGLADLTEMLKRETTSVNLSASEIMARISRQTQRLDAMLTEGLDTMERATGVLESAIARPVRQVNGVLAAIRAMVGTYRGMASNTNRVEKP